MKDEIFRTWFHMNKELARTTHKYNLASELMLEGSERVR